MIHSSGSFLILFRKIDYIVNCVNQREEKSNSGQIDLQQRSTNAKKKST